MKYFTPQDREKAAKNMSIDEKFDSAVHIAYSNAKEQKKGPVTLNDLADFFWSLGVIEKFHEDRETSQLK